MARSGPRIKRGTRRVPVRLALTVEEASKQRFDQIAAHVGMSGAAFFEALMEHLEAEMTDRGYPVWMPAPLAKDGELPIDAA